MFTEEIKRIVYKKSGRVWEVLRIETSIERVYDYLAHDLIAKKIQKCTWIKSIKNVPRNNGTRTIYVYYDNDTMSKYIIKD